MGGAASITLLLGIARTKFAAVLIGTGGVGLLAGFTAIQNIVGIVAGLGVQSSAVREIAAAVSRGDDQAIGRIVRTLWRVCWITGLFGMLVMMTFSSILSYIAFDTEVYTLDVALLGIAILMANLTGGQLAVLQGMRRIGDMARANIGSAVFSTFAAIGFYYWLGVRGITPSLVCIAAIQMAGAWYFARRIPVQSVTITWIQSAREATQMIKLGLVVMWTALMVNATSFLTIILISHELDLNAVGLFSAAFTLSSISVNFVLSAMAADYYPRLVSVADDKAAVNRLVNEQIQAGLLLAIPGLLASVALAPWLLQIFYTREFTGASVLLQWFLLGCLGRMISFPLGFVILALGRRRWYLLTETTINLTHLALIAVGLEWIGINGVAVAFFVMNVGYIFIVFFVVSHLTGFGWTADCRRSVLYLCMVSVVTFVFSQVLSVWPATLIGVAIALVVGIFCLRELARLVGPEHRVVRIISMLPGAKRIVSSK